MSLTNPMTAGVSGVELDLLEKDALLSFSESTNGLLSDNGLHSDASSHLGEGHLPSSLLEGALEGVPLDMRLSPSMDCPLEPIGSGEANHTCMLCQEPFKDPRILACLHVFCLSCIKSQLSGNPSPIGTPSPSESAAGERPSITCPECEHVTYLASRSPSAVERLPQDFVLCNLMDTQAIKAGRLVCTSCKAQEKAMARCRDCASYLCPNCVTAHQYMRCFENHRVMTFEEILSGDGASVHRPNLCLSHPAYTVSYYCKVCQVTACGECARQEHSTCGLVLPLSEVLGEEIDELRSLAREARSKVARCEESGDTLNLSLTDLQGQMDVAKKEIDHAFKTYLSVLEKRQQALLDQLEGLHKKQELTVMDRAHTMEKTVERIEAAAHFTDRVLKHGNSLEILSLKKVMVTQLQQLINSSPRQDDVTLNIQFSTDEDAFVTAIQEKFGHFKIKDDKIASVGNGNGNGNHDHHRLNSTSSNSYGGGSYDNNDYMPSGLLNMPGPMGMAMRDMTNGGGPGRELANQGSRGDFGAVGYRSGLGEANGLGSMSLDSNVSSVPQYHPHHPMSLTPGDQVVRGYSTSSNSACGPSNTSQSPTMSDSGVYMEGPPSAGGGKMNYNNQGPMMMNGGGSGMPNLGHLGGGGGGGPHMGVSRSISSPAGADMSGGDWSRAGDLSNLHQSSRATTPGLDNLVGSMGFTGGNTGNGGHTNIVGMNAMGGGNGGGPGSGGAGSPPMGGTPICGNSSAGNYNSGGTSHLPFPNRAPHKTSSMQIRCKFGQLGPGKTQFNSPHGFCLGMDEDIVVADTNNHRIQVFDKSGEFKFQFGVPGREEGQLWYPRKVAVFRNTGRFVICDRGNERSRMQIFSKTGHFLKKVAIRYIDIVAGLAITQKGHIVAVDSVTPTIFIIFEAGDLHKWFDCSDYMREPSDLAIRGKELYVCDFKGHCVAVFTDEGQFLRRIGSDNITSYPNGIDISDAGDILVGDSHGNRFHVTVFQRDGSVIGEFECPYVKVSRCCGLKITEEGYVVTLAKNNHHVLVLNTLYIN